MRLLMVESVRRDARSWRKSFLRCVARIRVVAFYPSFARSVFFFTCKTKNYAECNHNKALGKASTKPSKTLDKNVHWNEIAAYSRLALGTGQATEHVLQVQHLVPEVLHLVTLLASQGDATMRSTIYGLTVQLFQALYYVHTDDANLCSDIRSLLSDLSNAQTVRLFGLSQTSYSSDLVILEKQNEREMLEGLTHWLLRAIATCSGNIGMCFISKARTQSNFPRSGKYLESTMDGPINSNCISAFSQHSASSLRCYGYSCIV